MGKVATNISIDSKLKADAITLFSTFGLDLSTAITLFLSQSVREQRIPFEIKQVQPNETTLKALSEYNEMVSNKDKYKRYDSLDDIIKDIGE